MVLQKRNYKAHRQPRQPFSIKTLFTLSTLLISLTSLGGIIAILFTPIFATLLSRTTSNTSNTNKLTHFNYSYWNTTSNKHSKICTHHYNISTPPVIVTHDKQTVITQFFTNSQPNIPPNAANSPSPAVNHIIDSNPIPNTLINTPRINKPKSPNGTNYINQDTHLFSICSHNITTVAAHSDNNALRLIKSNTIKNLITNFSIVCLQETKLLARAPTHLNLPNYTTFYNCNPANVVDDIRKCTAGTAIILNNDILKYNTVTAIPLHRQLEGHAQMIIITNKLTLKTTKIINIRLLSTNPNNFNPSNTRYSNENITELQNAQLKLLNHSNTIKTDYTFLVGDFNFVDSIDDTSTPFKTTTNFEAKIPAQWPKLLTDNNLHEAPQPLHTYFHISDTTEHSAKLDRIYISHDEADYELTKPTAFTHFTPFTNISSTSFNQHIPVGITFHYIPPNTSQNRKTIPHWIVADDRFVPTFKTLYKPNTKKHKSHHLRLQYFKSICFKTSKILIKTNNNTQNKLCLLQACIKLRRLIHAPDPNTPNIIKFLARYPHLTPLVQQDFNFNWNTDRLKRFINKLYAKEGEVQQHSTSLHELLPQTPDNSNCNNNKTEKQSIKNTMPISKYLKTLLPSSRERITHLRKSITTYTKLAGQHLGYSKRTTTLAPTNDPLVLGEIIHSYWSKVWEAENFDDPLQRAQLINTYLNKYNKQVNQKKIKPITLSTISNAIQHSGNTLHGPDGIPFVVWRALSETACPLLLNTAIHLTGQHVNVRKHNQAMLLLLPKPNKDSHMVNDTRPLSISNTDNRIIARAVLSCIIEATKEIVDPRQNGFIPGRRMTDNIHKLNHSFYTALAPTLNHLDQIDDEQLFVLFVDNEKAFDSIHHDFIHATLKKQNWPFWFRNIAFNLLQNVSLTPTLAPHINIPVQRGVKQGCPLSPIIFVLIYDVLITNLANKLHHTTTICGAADDLAIASPDISHITNSFHILDEFANISGLRINRSKTQILSTIDNADDNSIFPSYFPIHKATQAIVESAWPLVQLVNDAKYLGIKFSNLFSHNDNTAAFASSIFSDCLSKAQQRIKHYYPSLKSMSMHKKILTINIFVSPIFSYLNEFYIIPARTYYTYTMLLCKTVIPYKGTGFKYEHLVCPRSKMGPHTPLNDIWIANITRLIYPFITKINNLNAPWGYNTDRNGPEHEGVYAFPTLIQHNRNLAIMEFLSPKYYNWDGQTDLSKLNKKTIKETLINKQFHQWADINSKENKFITGHNRQRDLQLKFQHFSSNSTIELTLEHFKHINKKIPPYIINHHLKLYTNSLATDRRIRHFAPNSSVHPNANSNNPYPCYLCNIQNSLNEDGALHIYQNCLTTKNALALLRSLNHIDLYFYRAILNNLKQSPLFHLQYMVDSKLKGHRVNFIVCFNYAIWHTRRRVRHGHIGTMAQIAQRIVDHTTSLKALWAG